MAPKPHPAYVPYGKKRWRVVLPHPYDGSRMQDARDEEGNVLKFKVAKEAQEWIEENAPA